VTVDDLAGSSVTEALDALVETDPPAGHLAQVALVTLSGGEPLDSLARTLTQRDLQHFLWHELAMWWWTDAEGKRRTADALGRVLTGIGLERYGEICRSPLTRRVLAAFDEGLERGVAARRVAIDASPITIPDTSVLEWSDAAGPREVAARWHLMDLLELAVAGGDLDPARRGWRRQRQDLVEGLLLAPRPELAGRTYRDAVVTERLGAWLDHLGPTRGALYDRLGGSLLSPLPRPADVRGTVRAVEEVLASAAAPGGLSAASLARRLGAGRAVAVEVGDIIVRGGLAGWCDDHLVARRADDTAVGRQDPWDVVVGALLPSKDRRLAFEVVLLVLAAGATPTIGSMIVAAVRAHEEEGRAAGGAIEVLARTEAALGALTVLGLACPIGQSRVALSVQGHSAARNALAGLATGASRAVTC